MTFFVYNRTVMKMIRKTRYDDIERVSTLYKQASASLKAQGIDQWQNNYPNQYSLKEDIDQGISYVYEKDGNVIASVALILDGEVDYDVIEGGQWLDDLPYLTIHRIVIENQYQGRGISQAIMAFAVDLAQSNNLHSIRVDTHQDNRAMQGFLEKEGFHYCGIVYINQSLKRYAYHKQIKSQ